MERDIQPVPVPKAVNSLQQPPILLPVAGHEKRGEEVSWAEALEKAAARMESAIANFMLIQARRRIASWFLFCGEKISICRFSRGFICVTVLLVLQPSPRLSSAYYARSSCVIRRAGSLQPFALWWDRIRHGIISRPIRLLSPGHFFGIHSYQRTE